MLSRQVVKVRKTLFKLTLIRLKKFFIIKIDKKLFAYSIHFSASVSYFFLILIPQTTVGNQDQGYSDSVPFLFSFACLVFFEFVCFIAVCWHKGLWRLMLLQGHFYTFWTGQIFKLYPFWGAFRQNNGHRTVAYFLKKKQF
jgi:hypothetical protein